MANERLDKAMKICMQVHSKGLVSGASGNLSFKEGPFTHITKTGCSLGMPIFTHELCTGKASSDYLLHLEMYRLAQVKWVIHCHCDVDSIKVLNPSIVWQVPNHGVWLGFADDIIDFDENTFLLF